MSQRVTEGLGSTIIAGASGVAAVGASVAVVGVYALGMTTPARHDVTASATYSVTPQVAWAVVSDPGQRLKWRPHVEQIARSTDADSAEERWREVDDSEDRFEFVVHRPADDPRSLVLEAANPEEIGMEASWTWRVTEVDGQAVVSIREQGVIANPLFRGVWKLRYGPYAGIEADFDGIATLLGTPVEIERAPTL